MKLNRSPKTWIPQGQRAFLIFRPTPSCGLFLICGSYIVPRPRAEGGAGDDIDLPWRVLIQFAVITSARPVSLTHRSFDYSKSACGSSVPFRLISSIIRYGRRGRSRRHHPAGGVSDIPTACALAFLSPPIRYGRRGDDVPGVSICGRYRWRMEAAHVGGGLLFRYDPVPIRLRRSVLLVVCPIRGTGRGLVCRPSSRYLSVSRSCRWCSGR